MSLTAGVLSQVSVTDTIASLVSTAASGGTGPYTQQWYRSTTTGFSPGVGNIITGATDLTLTDTGLIPNTQYFYKVVYTDTGDSNTTVTSSQLAVSTTVALLSQNQFDQKAYIGTLDLRFDYDTVSAQIDVSQVGSLYSGAAVKIVDSADGAPKVVLCTADTDEVFGFINFDIKTQAYIAGSLCELSQDGNVLYLYATGAISRGAQVVLDITTMGGVKQATGSTAANIVGFAYDKATAAGALIRVKVACPSFAFDA
jgi:hypothetical protein